MKNAGSPAAAEFFHLELSPRSLTVNVTDNNTGMDMCLCFCYQTAGSVLIGAVRLLSDTSRLHYGYDSDCDITLQM